MNVKFVCERDNFISYYNCPLIIEKKNILAYINFLLFHQKIGHQFLKLEKFHISLSYNVFKIFKKILNIFLEIF